MTTNGSHRFLRWLGPQAIITLIVVVAGAITTVATVNTHVADIDMTIVRDREMYQTQREEQLERIRSIETRERQNTERLIRIETKIEMLLNSSDIVEN